MFRSLSSVTAAAIAAVCAMTTFALWSGCVNARSGSGCFGPACGANLEEGGAAPSRSLGLIDL